MDTKPVGFISIWMADHFIHHLFIDPNHQGQRLGEALLEEGLKIIGRPARLKCVVRNARACKFYEKHGWTIESTSQEGPMGPYRTYILVPSVWVWGLSKLGCSPKDRAAFFGGVCCSSDPAVIKIFLFIFVSCSALLQIEDLRRSVRSDRSVSSQEGRFLTFGFVEPLHAIEGTADTEFVSIGGVRQCTAKWCCGPGPDLECFGTKFAELRLPRYAELRLHGELRSPGLAKRV